MALRTQEDPNNRVFDPFFLFPTHPSTKAEHRLVWLKPERPALSLTKPERKEHKTKIPTNITYKYFIFIISTPSFTNSAALGT